MEISKIPNGAQSVKFFSQMTEKRMLVKRVGWISNEELQMCISTNFVALVSNSNFELVEAWDWQSIVGIQPSIQNNEEFILVVGSTKHKMTSSNRSKLLCHLLQYKYKTKQNDFMSFNVKKIKANNQIKDCTVQIQPYGIVEMPSKPTKKEKVFLLTDVIRMIPLTDTQSIAFVFDGNEFIVYSFSDRRKVAAEILTRCKQMGIKMSVGNELPLEDLLKSSNVRKAELEDGGSLVELKASHGPGKTERIICFTEKWFVERDSASYGVRYSRALNDIIHILRGRDAMEVVVTFADGKQRTYYTSQREAFIASLFDCSLAAKADPIISDIPRFGSLIIEGMTANECGQTELSLLKNLSGFDPTRVTGIEPLELFMINVFLLNNNMPPSGPQFAEASRSKLIVQALEKLLTIGKPGEGFLQCLHRLLSTRIGYETFVENKVITEKVTEVVGMALQSVKPIVLFWALRIVSILLCSSCDENTEKKGKLEVMTHGIPERIFATLVGNIKKGSPLVVHGCVTSFKYIVCEPYSNTTEFNMFNRMMGIISGLGRDVFMLFQSPCISVPHIAGQILRSLVEETDMDERIKELQDYALLEGITLKYLQLACFSTPKTTTQLLQKHLALHLLDVFTADHKESESVLKRTIPNALLGYLDSTEQPPEKLDIDDGERQHPRPQMSAVASFWKKWNVGRSASGTEIRTRQKRIIKQKRNWGMLVFQLHQQHRRADLIWNHQTRQELKETLESEIRQLKKDQEEGEVAWNYREFIVEYHSLDNEVCVDGCFIKCLLENGEITLTDPRDFFDTLYHRCLFETNRELQALAIQAMSVVYNKFNKEVGPFKDIAHIVSMLKTTRSLLLRDRLVELIRALLKVEINARKFIDVGGIDLYVDLVTLVHLHADHAIIPLQSNLLTAGASAGEWYYVEMVDGKKEKKGPVSMDQLKELLAKRTVEETTNVWAQGMEDWKPLKDVTVLKWALLKEDTGIFTPLQLCQEIIGTVEDLVTMYPSRDMHGILLRPIPRAKRLLSSPRHLPHIVQLLLTAAPQLIDISSRLLKNLLEDNPTAQPKFYLTGAFYFALMYSGSNLKEIAKLLFTTHRQQKIGDAIELSVLKPLLPASLITVIDRSPEEFAARLVGEVATPEIRWGSSMRSYLVDTISQHIGDFASRLACNPLAVYSHVPIAPIVYEELKGELYCGKVYLKQLCDEQKYPDYLISDPVGLLQSVLHTWVDMAEAPKKMSTEDACQILGVESPDDKQKLRKAYYRLAQKYHPDRNPEGRDMFEKVNVAYNQLVEAGPDDYYEKADIIIHSQCILYERCGEYLSPYKYAGYSLLIPALQDNQLRGRALQLVYLTIRSSTLNVQELARLKGLQTLLTMLDGLCGQISEGRVIAIRYILRAMAVAAKFPESLHEIKKSATLLSNVRSCLGSDLLGVVEAALECATCFSLEEEMRIDMFNRNYLGYLIHRVLSYDPTLEEAEQKSVHQMKNAIAGMSLLAMKALVKMDENTEETKAVFALFTPQLAIKIRTCGVAEVLTIITSTTQTPYLLWTNKTRQELIDYVDAHLGGTMEWSPKEYITFRFPSLQNELVLGGVYVRLFNEQIRTCDPLPDPMLFLRSAMTRSDITGKWLQEKVMAVANVLEQYQFATEFCEDPELLDSLFGLLKEEPEDVIVQSSTLRCVKRLLSTTACVEIVAKSKVLSKFLVLLYPSSYLADVIPLAQALFSVMTGLQQGILRGGLLYLLNHYVNDNELETRVLVAQLIAKMATTPSIGPKVTLSLAKFFPASIVNTMKMDARGAVVLLDSTAETPELIWNPEMKKDVGDFILQMTEAFHKKQSSDVSVKWQVPDTFKFGYKELENELCIGGVFVRILNQNPTCPLNNPNAFSDGLFNKYQEAVRTNNNEEMKMLSKTAALFYTNQPQCLDYIASSGHLSKIIESLQNSPNETLFIILQVLVTNTLCKDRLIDNNAVPLVALCLSKLPQNAQVIADVFRSLTTNLQCKGVLCYVPRLCNTEVQESIFSILNGSLDKTLGSSAPEVKALIVDALQNALQDASHSAELDSILNQHPEWRQYSTQKHGLYLSGASSIAGYIAGPTASNGAVGLLTAAEDASVHRPDAPPELK